VYKLPVEYAPEAMCMERYGYSCYYSFVLVEEQFSHVGKFSASCLLCVLQCIGYVRGLLCGMVLTVVVLYIRVLLKDTSLTVFL
jgi:hypothetical protein